MAASKLLRKKMKKPLPGTAGRLVADWGQKVPPTVHDALDKAVEAFEEPSLLNLCESIIYHVRKIATMRGDPEKMRHHLKIARRKVRELNI